MELRCVFVTFAPTLTYMCGNFAPFVYGGSSYCKEHFELRLKTGRDWDEMRKGDKGKYFRFLREEGDE